jgi:hypothetical protein
VDGPEHIHLVPADCSILMKPKKIEASATKAIARSGAKGVDFVEAGSSWSDNLDIVLGSKRAWNFLNLNGVSKGHTTAPSKFQAAPPSHGTKIQ